MFARVLIALAVVFTAAHTTTADDKSWLTVGVAAKPVQVARGRGFIVHAMPTNREISFIPFPQHYTLLHTSVPDGKLKVMLTTGENVRHSPPMGIDRTYYEHIRLCGVICKKQRLFVLTSHSHATVMHIGREPTAPKYIKGSYRLTLYDARDGEALYRLDLKSLNVKEDFTATYEAGPLKWNKRRLEIADLVISMHRDQLSIVEPASAVKSKKKCAPLRRAFFDRALPGDEPGVIVRRIDPDGGFRDDIHADRRPGFQRPQLFELFQLLQRRRRQLRQSQQKLPPIRVDPQMQQPR